MSKPARVFVVEDEALIAMELCDKLERLGYTIVGHAARASAALEKMLADPPDVALIDINLGPGMTGIELASRIVQETDSAVIFLTAHSDADLVERAVQSHSSMLLTKPIATHVLRANIDMVLGKRSADRMVVDANRRLSELNHRMKNLMQLVASIVNLQMMGATSEDVRDALKSVQVRIRAIVLVQQQLSIVTETAGVALRPLLEGVASQLALLASPGISVQTHLDFSSETAVPADLAVRLGMVISELMSNAMQHAFVARSSGALQLTGALRHEPGRRYIELVVRDDGVGFVDSPTRLGGLGHELVAGILQSIDGTYSWKSEAGASIFVKVPMPEAAT